MKALNHQTVGEVEMPSPAADEVGQEHGASAVEYSLLVAFIATVIFAAATALGLELVPGFQLVMAGL